ncbi:hypothetical protein D7Y13_03660 [Corallococcus praedator]|uniref:Putative zinc-finger domain-containing protein n=1 Tax=Corallococcus praedator TaxID=2316724 RepID=A0ABX9QQG2_9BACT|nr:MULTISPECIES: zf-HC2 domain-containing protein [Corallococcus]RKH14756.1 hypothetical protein D7X74_19595 [Corallococcus sp. CA047B]RKH35333.1 hypothetical protein D7X75_04655 [Corallococcus sp. CA031C]RKI15782.1 hypothetical protein D7Y13_03660 [Corallococcus praedator]
MSTACEDLRPLLDGELAPEDQRRVRGHLAGCEACAARFHDLLQLEVLARLALEDAAESERWVSARRVREDVPGSWDEDVPANWPGDALAADAPPPPEHLEGRAWHQGARRFRRRCPGCASCCPWFAEGEKVEALSAPRWPCPRASRAGGTLLRPRPRR